MGNKTLKWYPKITKKGNAFAKKEYETDGYEREWLAKGYYHGYLAGVKAMKNKIRTSEGRRSYADVYADLVLGFQKKLKIC